MGNNDIGTGVLVGRRRHRRAVVGSAVALLALAAVPATGSFAQSEPSGGATVQSEGWWNATPSALELPPTPLGPLPIPALPAPDVPEGTVPVAMRGGQPSRVGAIGIVVDAPRGSGVTTFVLTLKEAGGTGAQQGEGPAIRACPITTFLVPEANGPSTEVPEADCELASADGTRAEDGTWTFDLSAMAALWLHPAGTVQANGVRLDPVGAPPATFQVVFTGVEDATLDVALTPPTGASDPFATGGGSFEGSPGGGSSFDGAVGGSFDGGSSIGGIDAPGAPVAVPTTGSGSAAPAGRAAERVRSLDDSRAGDTLGNWPASLALLVLVALALALAMAVVLGPAGRQRPDLGRRQGGVGRAVAARTLRPRGA